MRLPLLAVCVATVLGLAASADAALLGLTQQDPDIFTNQIEISYNAGTMQFSAIGDPSTLSPGGLNITNSVDEYQLNAVINPVTGDLANGTLVIGGEVNGQGTVNPLLTATLTDFGFAEPPVSDQVHLYEFLYQITGGDLAAQFGGVGAEGGVILTRAPAGGATFPQSFTVQDGQSDTFAQFKVPEPATASVLSLGAIALLRRRRCAA